MIHRPEHVALRHVPVLEVVLAAPSSPPAGINHPAPKSQPYSRYRTVPDSSSTTATSMLDGKPLTVKPGLRTVSSFSGNRITVSCSRSSGSSSSIDCGWRRLTIRRSNGCAGRQSELRLALSATIPLYTCDVGSAAGSPPSPSAVCLRVRLSRKPASRLARSSK